MKKDDLISRAAAIEQIKRMPYWFTPDEYCALTYDDIEAAINNASTVDAVPVVHGLWIDENPDDSLDPRMRCSVCTGVESPLIKWRYCPNCGAKMDDERKNSE